MATPERLGGGRRARGGGFAPALATPGAGGGVLALPVALGGLGSTTTALLAGGKRLSRSPKVIGLHGVVALLGGGGFPLPGARAGGGLGAPTSWVGGGCLLPDGGGGCGGSAWARGGGGSLVIEPGGGAGVGTSLICTTSELLLVQLVKVAALPAAGSVKGMPWYMSVPFAYSSLDALPGLLASHCST